MLGNLPFPLASVANCSGVPPPSGPQFSFFQLLGVLVADSSQLGLPHWPACRPQCSTALRGRSAGSLRLLSWLHCSPLSPSAHSSCFHSATGVIQTHAPKTVLLQLSVSDPCLRESSLERKYMWWNLVHILLPQLLVHKPASCEQGTEEGLGATRPGFESHTPPLTVV